MFNRLLFFFLLFPFGVIGTTINHGEAIEIGGIKQWVKFQGEDDQAPVLLFLHGGPGNSVMSYADRFTKELQKHFVVVNWDQRQSGQTALMNKSTELLTVSLFVSDGIELINFLKLRFSKEKIYLMGHSWGGYLGLLLAVARPDLLDAYFAINPMIYQIESEQLSLQAMYAMANNENNQEAVIELDKVEIPFKSWEQLYYHRMWLSKLMKTTSPTRSKVEHWSAVWLSLFNEASATNLFEFAPALNCPAYFLIGANDFQTHYSLAESYYHKVICKEKKLYWFSDSAHNPHLTESEKFQKIVVDIGNKKRNQQ